MKKSIFFLFFSLFTFLYFLSCNKEESSVINSTLIPNVESESSTTRIGCEVEKICSQASSYMILVYRNQPIPVTTCPTVSLDIQAKKITVDYGTIPCISSFDSVRRSGKYIINYYTNVNPDSVAGKITFSDFKIFKTLNVTDTAYIKISGDDDIGGKKISENNYSFTFVANNNFSRDNGTNGNALINFVANASIGAVGNVNDDIFTITGNGVLTNLGTTYTYNIYDTTKPLMIYGDCKYPKSGLVKLSANNSDVVIDFYPNSGVCDPIIQVIKNNVTVTVDLTTGN